mgnify:CR=1 FL=1
MGSGACHELDIDLYLDLAMSHMTHNFLKINDLMDSF